MYEDSSAPYATSQEQCMHDYLNKCSKFGAQHQMQSM